MTEIIVDRWEVIFSGASEIKVANIWRISIFKLVRYKF